MQFFNSQSGMCYSNPFLPLSALSEDVGTNENPLILKYVDRTIRDIKKYVKIVGLLSNEVLTEDKISKEKNISGITLKSNEDLDDLVDKIKFKNSSSLGSVDAKGMILYNSQDLTAFDNSDMKLSELSEYVGSEQNPLILCYHMENPFGVADVKSDHMFRKLYETPLPVDEDSARQNRRSDVGGIVHRDIRVIPWNLYWRDCYWSLCRKYWDTNNVYVFFSGTSGIGKSVFRSFLVWWHIQKAKELKLTEMILLMKSPSKNSFVHGVYFENGKLMYSFSTPSKKFSAVSTKIVRQNLRAICHIDVANGDAGFSGGEIPNSVNYFYTSPNQKAWKEKLKMESDLTYIPSWSKDELYDFYLKMGANYVLLNKLSLVRMNLDPLNSDSNSVPLQIPPSVDLYPLSVDNPKSETGKVSLEYGEHTYAVSYGEFKRVIDNEVDAFGPVPRYLFMDSRAVDRFLQYYYN